MSLPRNYSQDDDLTDLLVGRSIVSAELDVARPAGIPRFGSYDPKADTHGPEIEGCAPLGLLTLDDGTRVYAIGHDGGCCGAGDYELTRLATTENIITSVKVVDESRGDDDFDYNLDEQPKGRWSIFVVTASEQLTVAEFEGDDGNGYYGTGFHLLVMPAGEES